MKIFLLIVVIGCCFLIGLGLKNYLLFRQRTYKSICDFVAKLINNISFNNEKIEIFVRKEILNKNLKIVLKDYLLFLKNEIKKEDFKEKVCKNLYFLDESESNEIVMFFLSLGQKTKDEEIEFLENNLYFFKEKFNEESLKSSKFGSLIFKLLIIFGLMLFIIFV